MKWLLIWVNLLLSGTVWGQNYRNPGESPAHDECFHALILPENTWLSEDNYNATLSSAESRPPKYPATCIQTYENDLWYTFETSESAEYQITIVHQTCNTPAGLQSLLIQADECTPEKYRIISCSNKKIADTIKLFFVSASTPQNYLLYIDGYDGTLCSFDLQLKKEPGALSNPGNLKYNRFYSDSALCNEKNMSLLVRFENNKPVLSWKDQDVENTGTYVVERVLTPFSFERVAALKPQQNAAGFQEEYIWTDYTSNLGNEEEYAYRIIKLSTDGEKECSETTMGKAEITQAFYVTEPMYTGKTGIYQVNYTIKKKQDYVIALLDQDFNILKAKELRNMPVGGSFSQLDLNPYPSGTYYFRMSAGKNQFIRKIEKGN